MGIQVKAWARSSYRWIQCEHKPCIPEEQIKGGNFGLYLTEKHQYTLL